MKDLKDFEAAGQAYAALFDNFDEVAVREALQELDTITAMLIEAVRHNQKITREQLEAKFGPINWEW